jgi:hypothetical protein
LERNTASAVSILGQVHVFFPLQARPGIREADLFDADLLAGEHGAEFDLLPAVADQVVAAGQPVRLAEQSGRIIAA